MEREAPLGPERRTDTFAAVAEVEPSMPATTTALRRGPSPTESATWHQASDAFLQRDLAPGSRRIYRLTLDRKDKSGRTLKERQEAALE